jgi:hypothetical protein
MSRSANQPNPGPACFAGPSEGAHRGHITLRSTQKYREPSRSQPQLRQYVKYVGRGHEHTCTRPGLQADSPQNESMSHDSFLAVSRTTRNVTDSEHRRATNDRYRRRQADRHKRATRPSVRTMHVIGQGLLRVFQPGWNSWHEGSAALGLGPSFGIDPLCVSVPLT